VAKVTFHATPFALVMFLIRVGATVFIGLNAPWFVTVTAALLQVQVGKNGEYA
jgi:hypothetical protein